MEQKTINVYKQVGQEAKSRINVDKLQVRTLPKGCNVILDFTNVDFISRSFADEMITQLEDVHAMYKCMNETSIVHNIIQAVLSGRSKERKRESISHANIVYLKTVKDMSLFFNVLR